MARPRAHDWRHARVDLDPAVQEICRLPAVLAAAGDLIGAPFFLMQADGRDPLPGNSPQPLHGDAEGAGRAFAIALVFLDDYGPDNGATQLVPGSYRGDSAAAPFAADPRPADARTGLAAHFRASANLHQGNRVLASRGPSP